MRCGDLIYCKDSSIPVPISDYWDADGLTKGKWYSVDEIIVAERMPKGRFHQAAVINDFGQLVWINEDNFHATFCGVKELRKMKLEKIYAKTS